ncbi:MAG: AMIN domain-containing protein, partial [Kovacikia sp.]
MTRLLPVNFSDYALRLGVASTASMAIVGMAIGPGEAASLTSWQFNSAANQLELHIKDGTTPRYFLMAQPARIVIDLPNTSMGAVDTQKTYTGAIRQIRVSQFQPGLARIVMELSPEVSLAPGQVNLEKVGGDSRWVLRPLIAQAPAVAPALAQSVVSSLPKPIVPMAPVSAVPARSPSLTVSQPGGVPSVPPLATAPSSGSSLSPAGPAAPIPRAATGAASNSNGSVKVPPFVTSPSIPTPSGTSEPGVAIPSPSVPNPIRPSASSRRDPFPAVPNPLKAPEPNGKVPTLPANRSTSTVAAGSTTAPAPVSSLSGDIDGEIAVDTRGGVAIAVPPPDQKAASSAPIDSPAPSTPAPSIVVPSSSPTQRQTESFGDIPSTIASTRSTAEPRITVPPLGSSSTVSAPPSDSPMAVPPIPALTKPVEVSSSADSSNALPSTVIGADQPVTVSVPAMGSSQPLQSGPMPADAFPPTAPLPDLPESPLPSNRPTTQGAVPTSSVMQSRTNPEGGRQVSAVSRVVDFGQRLPTIDNGPQGSVGDRSSTLQSDRPISPDTLLPTGTLLDLRYPGDQVLKLTTNGPQQEVLLLLADLRDSAGTVIVPAGTRVIG